MTGSQNQTQNQISDPNIGVAVKAPSSVSTEGENVSLGEASVGDVSADKKGGLLKFDFTAFRVRFSKRILPILLIGLGLGVITLIGVTTFLYIKESMVKISKVSITNISNGSATVSWVSDKASKGVVYYGEEDKWFPIFAFAGKQREDDDRDVEFNKEGDEILLEGGRKEYFTHHVTIEGLNPDTRYFFRVGTGVIRGFSKDSEGNKMKPIETGPVIESLSVPSPIYGRVFKQDNTSLTDGIVFVQLLDGVERRSTVISTIVENGTWTIDVTNARTLDLMDRVKIKEDNLFEEVRVEAAVEGFNTIIATPKSDQPTTDIYLQNLESKENAEGENLNVLGLAQSLIFPASAQLPCSENYEEDCTCGNGSPGKKQCHKEGTSADGQPGSGCSWGSGSSCTACTCAGTGGGGDTGTGGGTGSGEDKCAGQYACSNNDLCLGKRWSENQQTCVYSVGAVDPCNCPSNQGCYINHCGGTTGTPPNGQEGGVQGDTGGGVIAKVDCIQAKKCCSDGPDCYCGSSYDFEFTPDATGQCTQGGGTCICKAIGVGVGTGPGPGAGTGTGGGQNCTWNGRTIIDGITHLIVLDPDPANENRKCSYYVSCKNGQITSEELVYCAQTGCSGSDCGSGNADAGVQCLGDRTYDEATSTCNCPANKPEAYPQNINICCPSCSGDLVLMGDSCVCSMLEHREGGDQCPQNPEGQKNPCPKECKGDLVCSCYTGNCLCPTGTVPNQDTPEENDCVKPPKTCDDPGSSNWPSCKCPGNTGLYGTPDCMSYCLGHLGSCPGFCDMFAGQKMVDEACRVSLNLDEGSVAGVADDAYTIEVSKSGKYLINTTNFESTTKEVNIFVPDGEKGQIRLFLDSNANGAKDEGEEYLPADAEVTVSLDLTESVESYTLSIGWNLIGLNLFPTREGGRTAKTFLQELNSIGGFVTHIATYRNGQFLVFSSRNGIDFGEDFNVLPGEAYFIRSYRDLNFGLRGNRYLEAVPVRINNGWNLMSIVKPDSSLTAQSVLDSMISQGITADALSQYESGLYTSIIKENGELFGRDFIVIDKRGYFVRVQEGGGKIWTP